MRTYLERNRLQYLAAATFAASLASSAGAADLPLARVVLSTAGLAQFTHAGPVAAGSSVDMSVRLDQVDDILKSLTVMDKQGAVGAVRMPGKTPLAELFKDLPFGPDALNSAQALLNALVGSEIEIDGKIAAKGRVLKVASEEVVLPGNGGTLQRYRLAVMTDKGLVQAMLDEITSLRFRDARVAGQIERALAGLSENRAKDRRQVTIDFLGQGTRNVLVSYVVAAPVWKTAYRLVLPKDGGRARLQGWAVVENLTGGDWQDVELVLASGNPVALRQPLYTALFPERIEVPVTTAARILPRSDDAGSEPATARRKKASTASKALAMPPRAAMEMHRGAAQASVDQDDDEAPRQAPADPLGAAIAAAEAEDGSTQLLYRFPAKVSLATGHTMMVPFVDREVSATRTWLYQPDTSARRPLAAVRLSNDGEAGLPAGIVTAYDAAGDAGMNFVGDARLPLTAKGAVRFLTFALDAKTDVRREDTGIVRTVLGKAAGGTLTLSTRSRHTIAYEITAPADEDREIFAEEARENGWSVASNSGKVDETPTRWRLAIAAPKGKTTKVSLVTEKVDSQSVVLTSLAPQEMLAHISNLKNESAALKDAITRLSLVVAEIGKLRMQRSQLDMERKKIADDQDRIRRNLQSVGAASDLGRRYLDTLKTQEDRLAEIGRVDATLEKSLATQRRVAEEIANQLHL